MAGKIYDVIDGLHKGRVVTVDNKQEPAVTAAKKVHAFFFVNEDTPYLQDGKHVNGLISFNKLKYTGFYD